MIKMSRNFITVCLTETTTIVYNYIVVLSVFSMVTEVNAASIFNKREMTIYLTSYFDFCCKGDCNVVTNNKTVRIDCLTRLNSNVRN